MSWPVILLAAGALVAFLGAVAVDVLLGCQIRALARRWGRIEREAMMLQRDIATLRDFLVKMQDRAEYGWSGGGDVVSDPHPATILRTTNDAHVVREV